MTGKVTRLLSIAHRLLVGAESSSKPKISIGLENGNQIINQPKCINSKITFNGSGNILYCEDESIVLTNSMLTFNGDNSVIYLSASKRTLRINVTLYNNSSVYVGKDNYFNGTLNMIASEQKNIIIGDGCLFSFGCWIRTADPHLVYDSKTKKRLNYSKSVLIGDHVWLGQAVMVLKGSQIGSGAIVGAASVVTGKALASNASYGGSPARLLRREVFFTSDTVHGYTDKQTQNSAHNDSDEWVYKNTSRQAISLEELDEQLSPAKSAGERLDHIKSVLSDGRTKQRFSLSA